jgi:hypothetical protein
MKENGSFQEFPAYVERSSNKSRFIFIFIVIIILIIAILAVFYFLGVNSKKNAAQVVPTPTREVTPTEEVPSSTPSASVSPSSLPSGKVTLTPSPSSRTPSGTAAKSAITELTLAILNGSGQPGAAKGISSYLSGLGYTIKTVGNADNFTYENITVKIKKSKGGYLSQLKRDISANSPNTTISTNIDDSITTDAEVIIGK